MGGQLGGQVGGQCGGQVGHWDSCRPLGLAEAA